MRTYPNSAFYSPELLASLADHIETVCCEREHVEPDGYVTALHRALIADSPLDVRWWVAALRHTSTIPVWEPYQPDILYSIGNSIRLEGMLADNVFVQRRKEALNNILHCTDCGDKAGAAYWRVVFGTMEPSYPYHDRWAHMFIEADMLWEHTCSSLME